MKFDFLRRIPKSLVFLIGIVSGLTFHLVLDILPFQSSDLINVTNILVNLIIGFIVLILIQKQQSDDRGVKDYFIEEVKAILTSYSQYLNQLYKSGDKPRHFLEWSKTISMRIQHLEYFLEYDLKIPSTSMQVNHRTIHNMLTDDVGFNESLNSDSFVLPSALKNNITSEYKNFKHSMVGTIIKINRA